MPRVRKTKKAVAFNPTMLGPYGRTLNPTLKPIEAVLIRLRADFDKSIIQILDETELVDGTGGKQLRALDKSLEKINQGFEDSFKALSKLSKVKSSK